MFVTRSFLKLQAGQVFLLFDNLLVAPTTYKLLLRTCLPKREKKNAFAPLHSQARSVTHLLDWSVRINLGLFCMQSNLLPGSTPSYWLFQSRNKGILAFDGKEVTGGSKHFEIKTMLSIPRYWPPSTWWTEALTLVLLGWFLWNKIIRVAGRLCTYIT